MPQNNTKCPGVKRLMREAAELAQPTEHYYAAPLEDNLFEWHFTVRGQEGTSFAGGIYHGRIVFPPEYPLKPPSVILLTPNGRFEINRRICLSISDHHPETWQPSWSIRTVLLAIVGFMPTPGKGAIGALDWTDAERKKLAQSSVKWKCSSCGSSNSDALLPVTTRKPDENFARETQKYAAELSFTADNKQPAADSSSSGSPAQPSQPPPRPSPQPPPPHAQPPPPPPAQVPPAQGSRSAAQGDAAKGGLCSLMLMYLLVGLISALFLRRVARVIYQEYLEPDLF